MIKWWNLLSIEVPYNNLLMLSDWKWGGKMLGDDVACEDGHMCYEKKMPIE